MASDSSDRPRSPVIEGRGKAYLPESVFYNPVQEFNRDLTINVISEFGKLLLEERDAKRQKNKPKPTEDDDSVVSAENEEAETVKVTKQEEKSGLNVMDTNEEDIRKLLSSDPDERLTMRSYEDGLTILEGLAASGLRSVRFSKEIPGLRKVIGNDFDKKAVACMRENIELNQVGHIMEASCDDAAMVMYRASRGLEESAPKGYDVIDLDPYGGPTKFLDGAVQAVKNGGLLCITCTDMAILCGNAAEKCYAAYGAMSIKSSCCHETALRIVLRTIDSYANRYAKHAVPLLSLSIDFYCRVFVRIYSGAAKAKESASKTAMLYECTGCSAHALQPLAKISKTVLPDGTPRNKYMFATGPTVDSKCHHCNHTHHVGGPLWAYAIHDQTFVNRVLERVQLNRTKFGTSDRMIGMLTLVSEELPDVPLYYIPDQLCAVIHCAVPKATTLRSALLNAGYRVSLSHAHKSSLKTDAPLSVIWDILRCWVCKQAVKESRKLPGTPCEAILRKKPELQANFEPHPDARPKSKADGLLRYQTGMKDWGPKARGANDGEDPSGKRKANQNRRSNKKRKQNDGYHRQFLCPSLRANRECKYGDSCKYSHDADLTEEAPLATETTKEECENVEG